MNSYYKIETRICYGNDRMLKGIIDESIVVFCGSNEGANAVYASNAYGLGEDLAKKISIGLTAEPLALWVKLLKVLLTQ